MDARLHYRLEAMLTPVGKHPAAIYWRRRLVLLAVVVIVLLTASVLLFGGGDNDKQQARASGTAAATSTPKATTTGARTTPATPRSTPITGCPSGWLTISAATGRASYAVNSKPDLYLVVVNAGPRPCTTDLADKQVVLTVSTGDVRVWGSHDCAVQPGTTVRTLTPKRPVRLQIVWSGTTSMPGCKGQRLVVQAGTYALTAALSGKQSKPATFTIT